MIIQRNKLVIIGAGNVGAAVLATLLSSQSFAEIAIIDKNEKKAYGEALDGSHSTAFAHSPNIKVRQGDYSDCRDASIIVMTAGASGKPWEAPDRLSLARTNLMVLKSVMEEIIQYTKEAILIIVSNPVDILTYYAQNNFDYPKEKIFGTGTTLDTARFRRIIGRNYEVDTKNVHGYILGEHGNTAFATWSNTNVAGIPIEKFDQVMGRNQLDKAAILNEVKKVGTDILINKGYTNMGIAKSVERIIQSIMINELSVLPLSTTLEGEYGIEDVALSLPCILAQDGLSKQLEIPLNEEELEALSRSAASLKKAFQVAQ